MPARVAAAQANIKKAQAALDLVQIDRLQNVAFARFQQLSAPLCAKAVEDTAFYRYGRR